MSRAAFLPIPGDTQILYHTLKYYRQFWRDEIDKLYININAPEHKMPKYLADLVISDLSSDPKIEISYVPNQLDHGGSINYMLERCKEDHIVLLEDDFIIFKKNVINCYFNMIENGQWDLLGSPRGCTQDWLIRRVERKFGIRYDGCPDTGPHFWPCLLFAKRDDLLRTDRNFCGYKWDQGQMVLDEPAECLTYSDTFVWASIQLRSLGLRVRHIPQYHCFPSDPYNKQTRRHIFDGRCGYFHIGSLSSILEGYVKVSTPFENLPRMWENDGERIELARRLGWVIEASKEPIPDPSYTEKYAAAVKKSLDHYKISEANAYSWVEMYKTVMENQNAWSYN